MESRKQLTNFTENQIMSRTKIRNRIKKFEESVIEHLSHGRIVSAEMDQKVVVALKLKLEDTISTVRTEKRKR